METKLVYFRTMLYPEKEFVSFKVSCYIPFPLEGLTQTIGPPMTRH